MKFLNQELANKETRNKLSWIMEIKQMRFIKNTDMYIEKTFQRVKDEISGRFYSMYKDNI